ncbi:hypothetical protein Sste5346_006138 [Sporothrix stenoceras]|uniref:NADP-dependent oxidoreductase domain-containing protein n=1 Tax=Sporothrix stenoceras TaxID=5173 RepID=A0ABR3Z1B9_9PEZI
MAAHPRVILGLSTFGPDTTKGARVTDIDEAVGILDYYRSRGYSELDTARAYNGEQQEGFLRKMQWQDKGAVVATKIMPPQRGRTYKATNVFESFETSLKELGAESVDTLYLHTADRSTPFEETLEALDTLHRAGKFRRLGLSNFAAFEVAEIVMTCKFRGWVRPTVYEGLYNCMQRGIEAELIPVCRRYGLSIVAYSVTAGGLLSGAIRTTDTSKIAETSRFSNKFNGPGNNYKERYLKDVVLEARGVIETAASTHSIPLLEAVWRWTVHHSALKVATAANHFDPQRKDGLILGVSSVEQLAQNLDAIEKGPLPVDVVAAFDEAWTMAKGEQANYYRGTLEYTYDAPAVLFGADG